MLSFKKLTYLQCTVFTSKILVDTEFASLLCLAFKPEY